MASSYLSFVDCATFLDLDTAEEVDQREGSFVHHVLNNIQTYHMEYDCYFPSGRLPQCSNRAFGDLIDGYVILQDPNHNEIEVQVIKKCNEMFFGLGWSKLKDVYGIWFGGWIDLRYVNAKLLTISVRTILGNEVQYPTHNPPFKYMLHRLDSCVGPDSTTLLRPSNLNSLPRSFVRSYLKALTDYDVESGILVLPWYGFGQSAFAFTFTELVLVDHTGTRYACRINFSVDANGELACKIWGGWADLCRRHRVVKGDRVRFAIAEPSSGSVVYVCVYPQIGIKTTLSYPLPNGSYLPLYISQQYFVAYC